MQIVRLALLVLLLAPPLRAMDLTYRLVVDPEENRVHVTATYSPVPAGMDTLRLEMQERYAYVKLDEPRLDGRVRCIGDNTLIREDAYHWAAPVREGQALSLYSVVPLDHRGLPQVVGPNEYEHPYLAEDHGLLVAGTLFIVPEDVEIGAIDVGIRAPEGWPVICPWPEGSDGKFAPESRDALMDDLIAIGHWDLDEEVIDGYRASIAYAPEQAELREAATPVIRGIVEAELELFGMRPDERYLFVFTRPQDRGWAGSPKTGSMVLSARLSEKSPLVAISHLVAHEFHHTWIHSRFHPPDELRFYNEGFTDYFAFLVCAETGLSSWEQFALDLGRLMDRAEKSPRRGDLSLAGAGGDLFFEDHDAMNLVYEGGLTLAALLDLELRAAGLALEEFMRAFNNDPRWSLDKAPSFDDFWKGLAGYAGPAIAGRYRALAEKPYDIDAVKEMERLGLDAQRKRGLFGKQARIEFDPAAWRSEGSQ